MKEWIPLVLIIIMGLIIFLVRANKRGDQEISSPASTNRERGFDRQVSFIEYSKHATCRMQCRGISRSEVEAIMKEGKINYKKSDLKNARCPRYALEGTTIDDQEVRIVFAQCEKSTVVVTAIDLDTGFTCSCPGDDDKNKNRN